MLIYLLLTDSYPSKSECTDFVATGSPNLLGLKNNKINQNMTNLDSTTRTSSGFQWSSIVCNFIFNF